MPPAELFDFAEGIIYVLCGGKIHRRNAVIKTPFPLALRYYIQHLVNKVNELKSIPDRE